MKLWHWLKQNALALDQVGNTLLGGWADETLSSHAYRLNRDGKRFGFTMHIIDAVFGAGHCYGAYRSERNRTQIAPEFRNANP